MIAHETCHIFGLAHCVYFECAMNASNSIAEALSQPIFLCPVCLRKLHKCALFDLQQRYQAMLDFFVDLNKQHRYEHFEAAIQWLTNCLRYMHSPESPDQPQHNADGEQGAVNREQKHLNCKQDAVDREQERVDREQERVDHEQERIDRKQVDTLKGIDPPEAARHLDTDTCTHL